MAKEFQSLSQVENGLPQDAGFDWLIGRYNLRVPLHWHRSVVTPGSAHRTETVGAAVRQYFPSGYWPGDRLGDHLEFALKYDGINLLILAKLFQIVPAEDIAEYVRSKPYGKYARCVWYLYELLTGNRLPISDLTRVAYVDLLDPESYYTSTARLVPRQAIRDNLMGGAQFCPIVRRTSILATFEQSDLSARCRAIMERYPVGLLARALAYLYAKESKSSFEIERITPEPSRIERFVALLHVAETEDFFNKASLIELQNRTVDERFADKDYRSSQNYVGQSIAWRNELVHFVSPKPQDLEGLMDGMYAAHRAMEAGGIHPVVHAAVIAYGFVFMHPFEDGNGRIHRFLIHNILARRGLTPQGLVFPVSAVMLKRMHAYDASLEAFSRPLMPLVDHSLDEQGKMTVRNDTADYYRYIDFTAQAESLFDFIRETIEVELVQELRFLANYDTARHAIQDIVDMPDRMIDLFIRCCLQNNATLSKRKRDDLFPMLSDDEVSRIQQVIRDAYDID